ncbi:hypothetical protein JOC95_001125 [Bacillus tianshenii]|uniref:DUF3898 domain-containing protein n=1 Tax=Sutcliffiella tianshenii TaxID=1463404 RepID=A0ABS2NX81_9BACI|nr:DUF3900 domain-containing protein [Bacillus tianshenii]MBM7619276.1 hypothetical protein [Bacillus tianshenii]
MDFDIQSLAFYVIEIEGSGDNAKKHYKQMATLDEAHYQDSPLKSFLNGELMKISKRKVDRHPKSDQVPTKIGRFTVEPGYDLGSNPNYNLFHRIKFAETMEQFSKASEEVARTYTDTTAVRGGVLIIARAKLNKYFDEPFVFVLKCDFEQKVASITDEKTLIHNVQMAITTKNMKSIQYPFMPEEGMVEEGELKIHQSSHSRYFEDFLKYVEYGESMPEIIKTQVMGMVHQELAETYQDESEEKEKAESAMEAWATSPKRELQERWSDEQVIEASTSIIEHTPDIELKFKLDHLSVKGILADFGENIHIARINNRVVVLLEGDFLQFEKNVSPVEMLKPSDLKLIVEKLERKH